MLRPGTLLGERYEIIEKIGAGGMSIVYKAKDNRLQRFVAIKELREEFVQDEEFVSKFRKEALSAASLSHPNIVGIYDVGSDHELHYIVMEYVEGHTLKQVIEEKGPFSPKVVLELGIQIVSALKHAHHKKIIHRDIKPQNILMTAEGVLKVTDFGIAKAVDSSTIVATGNAIGSVHYFSPEQAKGKYVNESSDLYSCGIVLFELATKRLPFEADSHISIALKHINEELPRPSHINPEIPVNLERLILKATSKNQADRYQNADEMLHDMRGILQNPNYEIKDNKYEEHTILLSAEDTHLLRQSEKEKVKQEVPQEVVKEPVEENIFEKQVDFSQDEEEESEVSTFYKVVASMGGVLATLALVVAISLAVVFWLPNLGKGKTYSVPNVIEMTLEQAQEVIIKNNLKYKVIQIETNEVENGMIIDQDPAAGTAVKKHTVIELTVAINNNKEEDTVQLDEEVEIPDFSNMDSTQVMREIVKLGLLVGETEFEYSDTVASGKVISQTPRAGSTVKQGQVIDLVISKGVEKVESIKIPSLIGMTVDEARATLEGLNLKLGSNIKEEYSDTEAGYIIRQSLSIGTMVQEGTKVDITISKGPKTPVESQVPEETPSVEPEPSIPADEPDVSEPDQEETVEPETPQETVVTQNRTITLPVGTEVKENYHLVVKLTLDNGTNHVIVDETVAYDNFPKNISISGIGNGKLDIYIDGKGYQENITF